MLNIPYMQTSKQKYILLTSVGISTLKRTLTPDLAGPFFSACRSDKNRLLDLNLHIYILNIYKLNHTHTYVYIYILYILQCNTASIILGSVNANIKRLIVNCGLIWSILLTCDPTIRHLTKNI